jgi:hypothetical protein
MNRRARSGRKSAGAARKARRLLYRVVQRFGRTMFGVLPKSMRKPAANDAEI